MAVSANIIMSEHTLKALGFIHGLPLFNRQSDRHHYGLKTQIKLRNVTSFGALKLLSHFGNVGIRGFGKTPKVCYLTKRSHGVLSEELEAQGLDVEPYRPVNVSTRWSTQMYHRIATLDVLMALERASFDLDNYQLVRTLVEYRRDGKRD